MILEQTTEAADVNNEWVEVINYQRELDEEQIRREKQAREQQKHVVKTSLE